ncbi:MAG: macro domain-containing protein [Thermodesulfobacteriota bacterium]
MRIDVSEGSILEADTDCIVNAGNSGGYMGGGVAAVIKRVAGREVEDEAITNAPIPIGEAVLTNAGKTRFKGIIHVPTMKLPGMRSSVENVAQGTRAALHLAEKSGFKSMAIPGLGTGVGCVEKEDAARAMIQVIKGFKACTLKKVVLIDIDTGMVEAWKTMLQNYAW